MIRIRSRFAACVVALAAVACSKKDSTSPGGASDDGDYRGIFAATDGISAFGGALVITVQAAGATGTLTPSGQAGIGLSGTFNTSTRAVSVSGGGHSLAGTIASGELKGTYTGPAGQGTFATYKGTSSEVQQFCGSYTGASSGTWNLTRHGNSLIGAYADDGGGSGALQGSISGTSISVTFTGGTASGTLTSATAMNGSWTAGADSGTWTGNSPC